MSAVLQEPSPLQRAALTLHALAEPDREWMLRSLSAAQRGLLQPLLRELETLGIPRDARLLEAFGTRASQVSAAARPSAPLVHAHPRALAAMLSAEPPRVAELHVCPDPSAPALSGAIVAQVAARLQARAAQAKPLSMWTRARRALAGRGERR